MYGKLFTQMYDGTLATKGPWESLVTFQQLIILADKTGTVDMTAEAIARRTTIPLDIIELGLSKLTEPDERSRSDAEEGRRLVPIDPSRDWGWRIVNYAFYRKIRSEDERREYHRLYARKRRASTSESTDVNTSTPDIQNQPIAVSSKQNAVKSQDMATSSPPPPCPIQKIVELYHAKLPTLPKVEKITKAREGFLRQRWREDLTDLSHWENFFEFVATSPFLMGRADATNGRPPFRADLEWLTRPANYAKIAENKYHHE